MTHDFFPNFNTLVMRGVFIKVGSDFRVYSVSDSPFHIILLNSVQQKYSHDESKTKVIEMLSDLTYEESFQSLETSKQIHKWVVP